MGGPTICRCRGTPRRSGLPIRDRRDAVVFKNSFKLTQTFGHAFVRPVLSFYHHNFITEQHRTTEPGFLGYENYVDRQEFAGGFDLGYEAWTGTWLSGHLGHRRAPAPPLPRRPEWWLGADF